MMVTMRVFATVLLLAPMAASCSGLGHLPAEFAEIALEAPQAQPPRIALGGGEVHSVSAPLGPGGVPADVRRAAEAIVPGGTTTRQDREWGPLGSGYRIEKHYPEEASGQWRSVLVDPGGRILERTHSLPMAVVPQAVLMAAAGDLRRDLDRIDVVQNINDEEFFRIRARDTIGREYLVVCAVDGTRVQVSRILQAELTVDR